MSQIVRGIVLSRDLSDLVIRATDAEVARFAVHAAVAVAEAVDATQMQAGLIDPGDPYLYNRHGERVAIIDQVSVTRQNIDITSVGSAAHEFIRGSSELRISARGLRV